MDEYRLTDVERVERAEYRAKRVKAGVCSACDGDGRVWPARDISRPAWPTAAIRCPRCNGTGIEPR